MTLEIRLLSFSTGQPHPLAEQPIIFIISKYLPFDHYNDVIEIVGDFLALLITFRRPGNEHKDMFFLVDWKKGEAHCVSDVTAHSNPIAYLYVRLASVLGVASLRILQFSFGRYPRHPEPEPEYTRNSQDRDQERRHPVSRSSMRAQPPSAHPTRLDSRSRLPCRTKPHRLRSSSNPCPAQPAIWLQGRGRHHAVPRIDANTPSGAVPHPRDAFIYIHRASSCAPRPHPRRTPSLCTLLLYPRAYTQDRAGTLGSVGLLGDALVRG